MAPPVTAASGPAPDDPITLKDLPLLVVEDDPHNAKLVAIIMRDAGCDVHVARSAEDGLAVVPIFRPRVIVLDLVLPVMGGVTMARRLKSDTDTKDIVVIAVTAFSDPDIERSAMAAGCAAYVRKPIDSFALPDLVLAHLRAAS